MFIFCNLSCPLLSHSYIEYLFCLLSLTFGSVLILAKDGCSCCFSSDIVVALVFSTDVAGAAAATGDDDDDCFCGF